MISANRLTKRYGAHAAIDAVSFEVDAGEIVGFLGPNGAGKSTTLRILSGFLGATSGRARVARHDVALDPIAARAATGYMPEAVPLYTEMRVREYLAFRAELKGVGRAQRASFVREAMEKARVDDVAETPIADLSKGYRQRVGLADALVAKPPVLILDEPTAGMDPNQIRDVRELVKSLQGKQTVLWSTHILSEVEATCGRVIVIDKGKIVAQGSPEELASARERPRVEIVARGKKEAIRDIIKKLSNTNLVQLREESEDLSRLVIEVRDAAPENAIEDAIEALVAGGIRVREAHRIKASLDEVFARLTAPRDGESPQ